MKHYFLTAKDVGDLTAVLCAALEEQQAKPARCSTVSRRICAHREKLVRADDFIIDNNRISVPAPERFQARSRQSHPSLLARRQQRPRDPS